MLNPPKSSKLILHPQGHPFVNYSDMTLTSTPAGNEAHTFRLTQSILVLGVVVGGVFLSLILANIAMGILLWVHERRSSERQSHSHDEIVSNRERPSAKKRRERRPLPGTLRMVYRQQTRTNSSSFDDDNVTFEVSESVHSSESEDNVDGRWHVIHEHSSGIHARPGTQLYQQKWQQVLNPKCDNASESQINQRININNQSSRNSNQSRLSKAQFQIYENGIIHNMKSSGIGSDSEKTCDYATQAGELEGIGYFNEQMGHYLNSPTENNACIVDSVLSSTQMNIPDKNPSSQQITEFPVLQDGLIIDIPIKRRSKKTKPSQPGKLYRKRHEIVRGGKTACRHYENPMSRRLMPNTSPLLSVSPPSSQEINTENKIEKNNGRRDNFNSGMDKTTVSIADVISDKNREKTTSSPDERMICVEERERKEQERSNQENMSWKIQGCPKMIEQCSEVSRTLYNVNERTNTVEANRTQTLTSDRMASTDEKIHTTKSFVSPVRPDCYATSPRSPILDWSISDDAKQSYFRQEQALPIDKTQKTTMTSTSDEMFKANPSGHTNYQPLGLKHVFIQSASAEEQVSHLHTISADSNHKKSKGRKTKGNDNYSNMRLVKMPTRRRSFMHRLFNRPKQTKNPDILKTFYSEDLIHSHTDSKRFYPQQAHHYNNVVYELEETEFQTQNEISPYVSSVHVPSKFPLGNVIPRFTLSEEDLSMYPDDSIPTIDELVQNGTIKRKKAAKKHIKRKRGNITNQFLLTKNENFALNVPKNHLRTEMQRYTNTINNATDTNQYSNQSGGESTSRNINLHPWGVDVDLIGFHTGVSDRNHSINNKRPLGFGKIGFQHRIGLQGPIFIPNPRMESNQNTTLTADNDHVNNVSKTDNLEDGNWNISITTTRSQSSKEQDSVSSFALSDFDMGESDVDEVSNISGDEDGTANDEYCVADNGNNREENVRSIEDVRL